MMKKCKRLAALALCALLLTACTAQEAPGPEAAGDDAHREGLVNFGQTGTEDIAAATAVPDMEKSTGYGWYFDTLVTVTFYGAPEGIQEEMWAACQRYEQLLSKTIEGSDVWRINHAGSEPVTVDPETWEILRRAKELSALSEGAFSVTIAPLSAMWDFTGGTRRMPTEEERIAALPLVDDSAIQLGEGYTVTLPKGMQVDLGGIAKGYIADQVAALLRGRVFGAIISLGGNTYVIGDKPDGSRNTIGVQDPWGENGALEGVLSTKNISVVTSGTYERGFTGDDGVWYHHILVPETGLPARSDLVSATILTPSSMTADALATACIVMGSEKAIQMLEANGLDALLIREDGQLVYTQGFVEKYDYMAYEDFVNR
ncbi:MAG: FAD:protein FMN transferase [Clostridia bacterium]|nr:FAD:protein FMN transferase [Clostridia bacterium]